MPACTDFGTLLRTRAVLRTQHRWYCRKELLERLPEAKRTVGHDKIGRDLKATTLDVDQQLAPALRTLANADLEADKLPPSGVAPIRTSMHSAWSSIRACR